MIDQLCFPDAPLSLVLNDLRTIEVALVFIVIHYLLNTSVKNAGII